MQGCAYNHCRGAASVWRALHRAFKRRGLTFGEMLCVLAVFLILATVFIFSSQTAMVRTKLSRTLQEERLLAHALDNYEADTAQIPTDSAAFSALSSAYITKPPSDPFNRRQYRYGYFGHVSEKYKWVVVSVGPDGVPNFSNALSDARQVTLSGSAGVGTPMLTNSEAEKMIRQNSYDPTNGTASSGDIITVYGQ